MHQYQDLIRKILEEGTGRGDRTGTGTLSTFGHQMRFDLKKNFPMVTGKYTWFTGVAKELIWFLSGNTNISYLEKNNINIWNEWADAKGELGPVYGQMWRSWPGETECIDQIAELMANLRDDPFSRRHMITGWNPAFLPDPKLTPQQNVSAGKQALPPCHTIFQFYVRELGYRDRLNYLITKQYDESDRRDHKTNVLPSDSTMDEMGVPRLGLSCQLYQRSADVFLGVPFNIASYALLINMMANTLGMIPDEFIWTGGDCHLYQNHVKQAREYLSRETHDLPYLRINTTREKLESYKFEDFDLRFYKHSGKIKAPIAV